ncbi:MAG: bifunctional [glutamate--ammonia ligase]-adenylyl-L-tyrosine phosphorylase/[glutamate--ammonia-ligase] adenylyltransferase [Deltaproteobacteria bacterium]|nr:bifunctional [glutamate--ammonia ligase]-adenylyl-L-tyrosine phosphorylase/[glutamate--ammonia-ligase] adenylyltransferase [Deltaproteobacteria bacterium]
MTLPTAQELLKKPKDEAALKLSSLGFADGALAFRNLKLLDETPLKPSVDTILAWSIDAPSPDTALNNLERLVVELKDGSASLNDAQALNGLIHVLGSSQFLANMLFNNHDLIIPLFFENGLTEKKGLRAHLSALSSLCADASSQTELMKTLRRYKQREFLRVGSADLLGLSGLEEVVAELSAIASASLEAAVEYGFAELEKIHGTPMCMKEDGFMTKAGFAVMGLGKLGGGELNFSSDIDIIYIYSSDNGETIGAANRPESRVSLHTFFVKLANLVTRFISAVTEDGFVFRADLDLRPEGRSGVVANSLRSAEIYYESWGQTWERAAMLKAVCVAGDKELGVAFLEMIRPFVYRRYLDFTAIEEIKAMKEKIDLGLLRKRPDAVDVKLGTGGIREIEFFCQALQLIHAGKDASVREKGTLKAIAALTEKGFIEKDEAYALKEAYVFLRTLEHRIQIVEGSQTHSIPAGDKELNRLARMISSKDTADKKTVQRLWDRYRTTTTGVHAIYRSLFYKPPDEMYKDISTDILALFSPDISDVDAMRTLSGMGFKDAGAALAEVKRLKEGPGLTRLSGRSMLYLQRLAPVFLARVARTPDPDATFGRLESFLAALGPRPVLYSLLASSTGIVDELVRIFGMSAFLSRTLIERPDGIESLLSKELSMPYRTRAGFHELTSVAARSAEYESKLDELRRIKNQEFFRIGINDLRGILTPRQVSTQITMLAQECLEAAYTIAFSALSERHGTPEKARFAIIGLGRLGGKELIYGSDLDIVFVYTGAGDERTNGPVPISAHEFFVKLGQRIISVLTLKTKEGFVFNVDSRLRPSGSAGPLVVSSSALIAYHREKTSVWERQAYLKARSVAGDKTVGEATLKELFSVLYARPFTNDDGAEMLHIRRRMETEIAKEDSSRYNIKTGKGGVNDIEFLVQAMQMKHCSIPGLRTPYTMKALKRLAKQGIINTDDAAFLKEAYVFFRLLEKSQRIEFDRPEGRLVKGSEEAEALAKRLGFADVNPGNALIEKYLGYAVRVRGMYLACLS